MVSTWTSGDSGASYGESIPVKLVSSPARALAYRPFGSRSSATVERRVDVHLDELARFDSLARQTALGPERRDERNEDHQASVDHQARHFCDSANVLNPIGIGEPKIAVQAMANVVAVKQVRAHPKRVSFDSTMFAMVDLPDPERPVNQTTPGSMVVLISAARFVDAHVLPVDVVASAQSESATCLRPRCFGCACR